MQIRTNNLPWPLDQRLVKIINNELLTVGVEDDVTINFRDTGYSPETGGYHPVEVALRKDGTVLYITDFCFVGSPPHCDLCKCLDFDFSLELFGNYALDLPISEGREVFQLWQTNFIAYHDSRVYTVSVEPW